MFEVKNDLKLGICASKYHLTRRIGKDLTVKGSVVKVVAQLCCSFRSGQNAKIEVNILCLIIAFYLF